MKTIAGLFLTVLILIAASGCSGKNSGKRSSQAENDSIQQVPDTGYTGIKKYLSNGKVLKEVTFKNGVKSGITKTFYQGGQLYQTFWYENDMKEDSAKWYYPEGHVFRTTPFRHDTVHGIQKQFYRNGVVRAKIGYQKGMRTTYFEEFTQEGKLVKKYPEVVVTIKDNYQTSGIYNIGLSLSDKSKVKFYIGEFTGGLFDTTKVKAISTINGKASLNLKKSGKPTKGNIGIIAEITTGYGNKHLIYKDIQLPYNDLK